MLFSVLISALVTAALTSMLTVVLLAAAVEAQVARTNAAGLMVIRDRAHAIEAMALRMIARTLQAFTPTCWRRLRQWQALGVWAG